MNKTTDIVVIGAGIAGTSAAAALADCCKVTVLDQESHPGYHATGRSAATWAPFYGPPIIQQLTALSLPLLATPDAMFSGSAFTSPKGEMMLGLPGDEAEIEKQLALGMQRLTMEDARQLVPLIKQDSVASVLYTDNMLDIDVDSLHQAYIRHLKRCQGNLICNARVNALSKLGDKWQVETEHHTYEADIIINAAGAWADCIAQLAGITPLGVQPKRRTAALVPFIESANMAQWPMVFGVGERFYCTPFGNGLMVSPADETPVEPHDAWPADIDVAGGIDEFQKYIDYDVTRVEHQWAGLRTFTPDGDPAVGFAAEAEGFFWLAGQGGYGIQTSPAMAAICRFLIAEDAPSNHLFPAIDKQVVDLLNPSRFC